MKIEQRGMVTVNGMNVEINGWTIKGGTGRQLKRHAILRAMRTLFWEFLR